MSFLSSRDQVVYEQIDSFTTPTFTGWWSETI